MDNMLKHPVFQAVEMIVAARNHAKYLQRVGDRDAAMVFMRAAQSMEMQLSAPAPGQAPPMEMGRVEQERKAGAPEEKARVRPEVMPPEARGFTPQQLRQAIGRGTTRSK